MTPLTSHLPIRADSLVPALPPTASNLGQRRPRAGWPAERTSAAVPDLPVTVAVECGSPGRRTTLAELHRLWTPRGTDRPDRAAAPARSVAWGVGRRTSDIYRENGLGGRGGEWSWWSRIDGSRTTSCRPAAQPTARGTGPHRPFNRHADLSDRLSADWTSQVDSCPSDRAVRAPRQTNMGLPETNEPSPTSPKARQGLLRPTEDSLDQRRTSS